MNGLVGCAQMGLQNSEACLLAKQILFEKGDVRIRLLGGRDCRDLLPGNICQMMRQLEISFLTLGLLQLRVGFCGPEPEALFGSANISLRIVPFPKYISLSDSIRQCSRLCPIGPIRSHYQQLRVKRISDFHGILDAVLREAGVRCTAVYERIVLQLIECSLDHTGTLNHGDLRFHAFGRRCGSTAI